MLPTQSVASYNYTDLASGTGMKIFYFAALEDNSGKSYNLVENVFYSAKGNIDEQAGVGSTTFSKIYDYDFDLTEFQKPQIIEGTAITEMTFRGGISAGSGNVQFYSILKIRKWDGSTETEVASGQSAQYQGTTVSPTSWSIVIPRTHFKIGETLRVTWELWARKTNAPDTGVAYIYHDPQNRVGTYFAGTTNISQITIPFKITL